MATTQRVSLLAPDISCGHCVQHINSELGKLTGVGSVSSSIDTKVVEVEYDPAQISLDTIKAALAEGGYPAQEVAA